MPRTLATVWPCACGAELRRGDLSKRRWMAKLRCDACEREHLKARLLEKVDQTGGCWLWQGTTNGPSGYGAMSVNDRPMLVHRLAYELFIGPLPEGMQACHRCDVRLCIRPDHLFAGNQQDNVDDMRRKGRASHPPRFAGASHPQAGLSDEQVAEVRRLCLSGVRQRDVAARFGVSQSTVWRLAHGRVRKAIQE